MTADEARLSDAEYIKNLISQMAETHYSHPDPVARLYGALKDVEAEVIREMERIREEEKNG